MMRYMKVRWIHDFADEPVLIYSEIEEGLETRKVECFRDGHLDYASSEASSGSSFLAEGLMPLVQDIGADPEFEAETISYKEFQAVWVRAVPR